MSQNGIWWTFAMADAQIECGCLVSKCQHSIWASSTTLNPTLLQPPPSFMTPTHCRPIATVTNGGRHPQPSTTTHNDHAMPPHGKNDVAMPHNQP